MKNKSYWEKRAARRMVDWQSQADAVADDIAKAYIKATNAINAEIKQIFAAFQVHNGLSDAEARRLLKHAQDKITADSLKKLVGKITDPEKRAAMEAVIESPAYAWRIGRLEALQENVDKWTDTLAEREQQLTTVHYTSLAKEAYTRTIFDIQKGVGFAFQFAELPQSRVREILRQNWSGTLFSKRIWGNSKDLNQKIMQELLAGFLTGRSYARTAKEIQDQMSVRAFEARRLVRTESTYIANSAELESYKESGVKKFRFLATLDMRTSAICAAMDGKLFDVEKGVIGVNIPPLHPWCRSTTVPEIDGAVELSLQKRAARDPKTGKSYTVPADMTYSEWKKSVMPGLAAKDGGIDVPKHKKPELLEKLDEVDYNIAVKKLKAYEKDIVGSDIENAIVITKKGEVWRCYGTENRVFPDSDLGDKLKGAYATHNHPEKWTEYSFSGDDYKLFSTFEMQVLRGLDYKYTYEFSRANLHRDKPADSVFDLTIEDYRHEVSIKNATEGGVGYWRIKRK